MKSACVCSYDSEGADMGATGGVKCTMPSLSVWNSGVLTRSSIVGDGLLSENMASDVAGLAL